jgi:hypothetical protein
MPQVIEENRGPVQSSTALKRKEKKTLTKHQMGAEHGGAYL